MKGNNIISIETLYDLISSTGFCVESIESVFYDETYTVTNIETIAEYENIFNENTHNNIKHKLLTQAYNISARKPDNIDRERTLEQILLSRTGED